MRRVLSTAVWAIGLLAAQPVAAEDFRFQPLSARTEAIPFQTLSLSSEQFLKGDASGKAETISGVLRIPRGTGRFPVVVFAHGSGGINANGDVWDRQFEEMGIATFTIDAFAGRGIVNTLTDQSQLGRLNMTVDLYRALGVLAVHPRVDPARIAVMGFSLGGMATLYSSVNRFQKMWNASGVEPAAYIALYPPCNVTFIGDSDVSNRPIRILHGISDDYVPIEPCRNYVGRLKQAGKDVQLSEYPDAWHAFDYPFLPATPVVVPNGESAGRCVLREQPLGVVINSETQQPFSPGDRCVTRNPHVAYSASATRTSEDDVKTLLRTVFKLN